MLHISSSGTGQNSEKASSTLTRSSVRAVEESSSSRTHRPEIPSAKTLNPDIKQERASTVSTSAVPLR